MEKVVSSDDCITWSSHDVTYQSALFFWIAYDVNPINIMVYEIRNSCKESCWYSKLCILLRNSFKLELVPTYYTCVWGVVRPIVWHSWSLQCGHALILCSCQWCVLTKWTNLPVRETKSAPLIYIVWIINACLHFVVILSGFHGTHSCYVVFCPTRRPR